MTVFVGHHLQRAANRFQKLSGPEQEGGVGRAPEGGVALGEGFTDEGAAILDRRHQGRQEWPVQIIGHDDPGEASLAERPGPGFQIRFHQAQALIFDIGKGFDFAVHRKHRMSSLQEKTAMPAAAGGKIKHRAAGGDQVREPQDPGRHRPGVRMAHSRRFLLRIHQPFPISLEKSYYCQSPDRRAPMILYDLACRSGHVFEAWFRDAAAFEAQRKGRKIACPECGNHGVRKAPMAPRIGKGASEPTPVKTVAPKPGMPAEMVRALRQLRQAVERDCEYVGPRFPEEARAMHYGEEERRGIYGEASDEEAKALADEGIEVTRIPWVPRQDA